ncbi:hypothetical protein [Actinoplanes teichomyceticus]|uniref:hypothetical protein n=1 Tax=Actinoplanes teichomyceticus TaxID=1867 RepID=UPI001A607952|nr:hypothetical protein [Actinoplanes teichomyceticus]GIF10042.1 hypothetical protein Ate01nite_00740 [Actinoplanes teichomyceticus]
MSDPHVHVEIGLGRAGAEVRNVLASTFGLVADLPATVETGCGQRVPRARTSPHPRSVTCLACREFASRRHRALAEQLASMSGMPGLAIGAEDAARVVAWHRDLADRFDDAG